MSEETKTLERPDLVKGVGIRRFRSDRPNAHSCDVGAERQGSRQGKMRIHEQGQVVRDRGDADVPRATRDTFRSIFARNANLRRSPITRAKRLSLRQYRAGRAQELT
jgi:hypothetical protein